VIYRKSGRRKGGGGGGGGGGRRRVRPVEREDRSVLFSLIPAVYRRKGFKYETQTSSFLPSEKPKNGPVVFWGRKFSKVCKKRATYIHDKLDRYTYI
jgi:hypothetical protein